MKGGSALRPALRMKIRLWLVSFHQLDPRYKILTFFNQVASDGADNLIDETGEDEGWNDVENEGQAETNAEKLLKKVFNLTSILTVWRPCSNDAMRKMMEGTGVGKGLDIKGKSSKKGLLSAYVPFMQIHDEKDKEQVQEICYEAKMRLYYSSREAREKVMATLKEVAETHANGEDPEKTMDGTIKCMDRYVKNSWFGLEVSQRLFWEAYVLSQDISRDADTETGRPSTAGFQDANLKTLKVATGQIPKPSPMPVVVQYDKNVENAMKPQTLVMAYEENGTVTPVVSDFDGFLLGWRREALWFGCNLPREQEDLMLWCVDHIGNILDSKPSADTWTVRWLEILKKEAMKGFHPDIPEYGFGDPKSYSIMEHTAKRLIDTGAVRHGMECFNYYFPQEIDEYFLLVSDTLPGKVPWKYVDVTELQEILSLKIQEGFVFPLNPKWILCDPGWKRIYDELMASDALYADLSKDVWYPPFSGVRKKIEDIHQRHPKGFVRTEGRVSFESRKGYSPLRRNLERGDFMSANAAFALAELELEIFNSKKNALAAQILDASLEDISEDDWDSDGTEGKTEDDRLEGRATRAGSKKSDSAPLTPTREVETLRNMFRAQRDEKSIDEGEAVVDKTPNGTDRRNMFSKSHGSEGMPRRNFSNFL
jgi:hypothetical protein